MATQRVTKSHWCSSVLLLILWTLIMREYDAIHLFRPVKYALIPSHMEYQCISSKLIVTVIFFTFMILLFQFKVLILPLVEGKLATH